MEWYRDQVTKVQNLIAPVLGENQFVDYNELLEIAEAGDLIEFCRGEYNHWAMYSDEDGKVFNICAESKECKKAPIKLQTLKYVCELGPTAARRRARVNNKEGFRGLIPMAATVDIKPLAPSESIKLARKMLDTEVEYSFTGKNCEYYCTLWKFGKGFTDQAYKY